jgi:hypothetical protein
VRAGARHPYVSQTPIRTLRVLKGPSQSTDRRPPPSLPFPRRLTQSIPPDRRYWSIEGAVTTRSDRRLPEIPTSTRRTASKVIYFHPEELARITGRARAYGQTPARFIREAALSGTPKRAADPFLSELTLIGQRLDQIVRLPETRRDAALATEVRAAIDRHWALVRRVLTDRRKGGGASAR